MKRHLDTWDAIAMIVGTVIGAGVLGIPYVARIAGIFPALFWILTIGLIFIVVNLCLGEVVLRTKGHHELVGLAKRYIGEKGKWLMGLAFIIGNYGALIAYTLGEGVALAELTHLPALYLSLLFFAVGCLIVLSGLKAFERFEMALVILLLIVLGSIVFFGLPRASWANMTPTVWSSFFVPYGVVVFASMGFVVIPELKKVIHAKNMKKAIVGGYTATTIIYVIFALTVIGLTGASTTEVATVGVGQILGSGGILLMNGFAVLTMATSFVSIAFVMLGMFLEAGFSRTLSAMLTFGVPLILFFTTTEGFVRILDVSGAISGGMIGMLILTMFYRAKKSGDTAPAYAISLPKLAGVALGLLFLLGILSALM